MMKPLILIFIFSLNTLAVDKIVFLKQNSQPKYFPPASKSIGLCDELYFLIKKEINSEVEKIHIDEKLYPIKRLLSMIELGEGHIFCGAGRNQDRERRFIYSKLPVYHVSNVVAAKKNELFIPESLSDLVDKNIVVGAYHGTSSAKFLKQQRGIRLNDNYNNFSQAFKELSETNLRYFYYHDLGLNYLIKESGLPLKVIPTKFRTVPQWIIYSKKTPERFVKAIESAIQKLHTSGKMEKLWKKYLN